jgi:hypothetical protein
MKKNDVGGETTSVQIVLEVDIDTSARAGTIGPVLTFQGTRTRAHFHCYVQSMFMFRPS